MNYAFECFLHKHEYDKMCIKHELSEKWKHPPPPPPPPSIYDHQFCVKRRSCVFIIWQVPKFKICGATARFYFHQTAALLAFDVAIMVKVISRPLFAVIIIRLYWTNDLFNFTGKQWARHVKSNWTQFQCVFSIGIWTVICPVRSLPDSYCNWSQMINW